MPRRTASDKALRYKTFNIAEYPEYDGYQQGFAVMLYEFNRKYGKPNKYYKILKTKSSLIFYR